VLGHEGEDALLIGGQRTLSGVVGAVGEVHTTMRARGGRFHPLTQSLWVRRALAGAHSGGVDDLEVATGQPIELVQLIIAPSRVGRAGDVPR
jgi:hypothetical protein